MQTTSTTTPVESVVAPSTPATVVDHDIVGTAAAAGTFSTLAKALAAADLVAALKGTGPFTVFAPTDEAFNKLAKGTLDGLLKDKSKLAEVLKFHVLEGKVLAADVKSGDVKTLSGKMMKVVSNDKGVFVNNTKVTKTDITASNGVIHVVDSVMMPF
jgi:uncharacterized surface protein with fasciclin (FAS1) repeats